MSRSALEGDFGPIARRRANIASAIGVVIAAAIVALVVWRFYEMGELSSEKWYPFATWNQWQYILGGLSNTMKIFVVDFAIAFGVGIMVAIGQLSSHRFVRWLAIGYAEVLRAMPTLLLILFFYFGLSWASVTISPFWAIVLGSATHNAASYSNILKAGVLSLDKGQSEAGRALGFRPGQIRRYIIAWPAIRRMLPSIISQSVILLKDSSLGYFIGYAELLSRAQVIGAFTAAFLPAYFVIGMIYVVLCFTLSRTAQVFDDRVAWR